MPTTYEPIATQTLGSAAATITFSSIPATYTDLRLVLVGTSTISANPKINFNSDTATNYSQTILSGNGSVANSARQTNGTTIFVSYYNNIISSSLNNSSSSTIRTIKYSRI